MSGLDKNAIVQLIMMIITLGIIVLFAYILWLVIRALRKYLKEK